MFLLRLANKKGSNTSIILSNGNNSLFEKCMTNDKKDSLIYFINKINNTKNLTYIIQGDQDKDASIRIEIG